MSDLLYMYIGGVVALMWMDALQTILDVKYERPFHYRFTFIAWPLFPVGLAVVLAERYYERKRIQKEHVKRESEYEYPVVMGNSAQPAEVKEKCKCGLVAGYSSDGCFYYCLVCGIRWTETFNLNAQKDSES